MNSRSAIARLMISKFVVDLICGLNSTTVTTSALPVTQVARALVQEARRGEAREASTEETDDDDDAEEDGHDDADDELHAVAVAVAVALLSRHGQVAGKYVISLVKSIA